MRSHHHRRRRRRRRRRYKVEAMKGSVSLALIHSDGAAAAATDLEREKYVEEGENGGHA